MKHKNNNNRFPYLEQALLVSIFPNSTTIQRTLKKSHLAAPFISTTTPLFLGFINILHMSSLSTFCKTQPQAQCTLTAPCNYSSPSPPHTTHRKFDIINFNLRLQFTAIRRFCGLSRNRLYPTIWLRMCKYYMNLALI